MHTWKSHAGTEAILHSHTARVLSGELKENLPDYSNSESIILYTLGIVIVPYINNIKVSGFFQVCLQIDLHKV